MIIKGCAGMIYFEFFVNGLNKLRFNKLEVYAVLNKNNAQLFMASIAHFHTSIFKYILMTCLD